MIDLAPISIKSTDPSRLRKTLLAMGRMGFVVDQDYAVVWNNDRSACDIVLMFERGRNEREEWLAELRARFPEVVFSTRCF